MRHAFETAQWVPYPLERVFAFFADPRNLPPLMPAWQEARVDRAALVPPPLPAGRPESAGQVAGSGSVLTISFRAFPLVPVRLRWVAVIEDFVWDAGFCDVQQSGPLAYWRHCHGLAAERRDGLAGSLVTDHVTYELPLGWIGDVANWIAIRRQVRSTFAYRQRQLSKLLAAGS